MKLKVAMWLNTHAPVGSNGIVYGIVYGIDAWHDGRWMHAAENGEMLHFDTQDAANAKVAEIKARWAQQDGEVAR